MEGFYNSFESPNIIPAAPSPSFSFDSIKLNRDSFDFSISQLIAQAIDEPVKENRSKSRSRSSQNLNSVPTFKFESKKLSRPLKSTARSVSASRTKTGLILDLVAPTKAMKNKNDLHLNNKCNNISRSAIREYSFKNLDLEQSHNVTRSRKSSKKSSQLDQSQRRIFIPPQSVRQQREIDTESVEARFISPSQMTIGSQGFGGVNYTGKSGYSHKSISTSL